MREFVAGLYRNAREHRGAVRILMLHSDQLDPEIRDQVWAAVNVGLVALHATGERELGPRGFPTTRLDLTVRAVLSLVFGYVALEPVFDSAGGGATDPEVVIEHLSALLLHGFEEYVTEGERGKSSADAVIPPDGQSRTLLDLGERWWTRAAHR